MLAHMARAAEVIADRYAGEAEKAESDLRDDLKYSRLHKARMAPGYWEAAHLKRQRANAARAIAEAFKDSGL